MNAFLILVLVGLMAMVVISLVRGIVAFMKSTSDDLHNPESTGPSEMQLKQNKYMFARIMYQGLAVLLVALILSVSK
ncbi:HIG1 domain-containing protein [Novosphingobium sp.]|uniref:HIG1 domain-containing protein n=1 Tax=Novosphingobium sp. TaxID=1874826 RepID=UPI002736A5D4|nr:HIG1 domain-containing protein [Novosphingobium sp.]MDP3906651.1 HIG1 domain-containing protein [Novosphingobium sp.]